jgi:Xaa-Pro dipeptidase
VTDSLVQAISERQDALAKALQQDGAVGFLATSPAGLYYLSGYRSNSAFMGFAAALLRPGETPLLLHPELETDAASRIPSFFETRTWTDAVGPAAAVVELVRGDAPVAVEERHLSLLLANAVRDGTGRRPRPGAALLDALRLRKDAFEVDAARRASRRLDSVLEWALAQPFAGRAELELQLDLERELRLAGADAWSVQVLGGPNTAEPRRRPGARRFQEGDVALIDIAASFDRMWSDITRCGCVGDSADEVGRAWTVLQDANRAGTDVARPGLRVGGVDESTRAVIETAGLGDAIVHRTGHGLGLEVIEPPAVSAENGAPIEAGMLFTVEPGLYFPGAFGVRLEESIHVGATGPEIMTGVSRDLAILG